MFIYLRCLQSCHWINFLYHTCSLSWFCILMVWWSHPASIRHQTHKHLEYNSMFHLITSQWHHTPDTQPYKPRPKSRPKHLVIHKQELYQGIYPTAGGKHKTKPNKCFKPQRCSEKRRTHNTLVLRRGLTSVLPLWYISCMCIKRNSDKTHTSGQLQEYLTYAAGGLKPNQTASARRAQTADTCVNSSLARV